MTNLEDPLEEIRRNYNQRVPRGRMEKRHARTISGGQTTHPQGTHKPRRTCQTPGLP